MAVQQWSPHQSVLDEQSELITRVEEDSLTPSDRESIVGLIKFNHWLQTITINLKFKISYNS